MFRRQYTPSPSASCRNQSRWRLRTAASAPDVARSSAEYSRTVSSIVNRGSGPRAPGATRAASSRSSSAVGTSTPSPATASTAASVPPPLNAPSAANTVRAPSSRPRTLQSIVARSERWRSGRSRAPRLEQAEHVAEAVGRALGAEQPHPSGRELERERQTLERAADARDRGGVRLGDREVGQAPPRTLDVEPCRGRSLDVVDRVRADRRHGERRDPVLVLAGDPQRCPARREDRHVRRRASGAGRGPARRRAPARGCRAGAARPRRRASARPSPPRPRRVTRERRPPVRSSGRRASGPRRRRGRRTPPRGQTARAASSARRVFPVPPGPVSVTSRVSGRSRSADTAASSRLRPTMGVDAGGRPSSWRGGAAGGASRSGSWRRMRCSSARSSADGSSPSSSRDARASRYAASASACRPAR